MENTDHLHSLKMKTRTYYDSIAEIYCPAIQAQVIFNSRGFRHLIRNGKGVNRNIADQIRRLNLVPHIVSIIKSAERIDEYRKIQSSQYIIEFWSLVEIVKDKNRSIRVVLKRIETGQILFWSVMTL